MIWTSGLISLMTFSLSPSDIDKIPRKYMSYCGDGVYALFDGFGMWLHANNHKNPTDRIYLEPEVLDSVIDFERKCRILQKEEKE